MNKFTTTTLSFLTALLLILPITAQDIPGMDRVTGRDGTVKASAANDGPANLINSSSYSFSAQSGIALEDMSGGTTLLLGGNEDNDSSPTAPIGFLFRFDGVNYTTFGVNINGLARLGDIVTTTSSLNALNSVTNSPKIMPFWDDLCTGLSGKVHYKTTGTFGNRKLIVEWQNMKITRGGSCDGTGSGVFQMWLFEGAGVVQFVYGNDITGSANGGYSIGVQSGAATNFASVTTATNSVDYATADNTQMTAITAGTSYLFSPPVPAAPTGGSVTMLKQASLQLNWTDNASGEDGYLVFRSTDNINFSLVGQLPADAASFADSGLTPSTQYFYRVSAMGNGGVSPGLAFSPTTNTPGTVNSTASGGLWSSNSTWAGGVIPDGGDTVNIPSGATVIIDTDAVAGSVKLGSFPGLAEGKEASPEGGAPAVLRFADAVACSLTVAGNVSIGANDSFTTGNGTITTHNLLVGGDLINNGTLDFSTNNNQAGATITFNGNSSNTFGGTGATTNIRRIVVNKGPTNANILELTPSNFTVQGSATDAAGSGYLTLNSGTFKISGTFSGSHRTFDTAAYNIRAEAGFWLNNPNYTIVALDDMSFVTGLLRISAGTWNVSGGAGQPMTLFAGSNTVIEGGSLNLAAGFAGSGTYTQTGGTVTTCKLSLPSSASNRCFSISGAVTMSGGEIVLQNPSAHNLGGGNEDYTVNTGSGAAGMGPFTGTTVRFGNASTNGTKTFRAGGLLPNVVIDSTTGGHRVIFSSGQAGVFTRNMVISPGATLEIGNYTMMGTSFINNGTIDAPAPGALLQIDDTTGTSDVNYSGFGVMTGAVSTLVIRGHSLTFDPSSGNVRASNVTVNTAQVINAARITFGTGTNVLSTIAIFNGAALDSAPDFNITTGGEKVQYGGPAPTQTGPEIRLNRMVDQFEYSGSGTVTITGGDLRVVAMLTLGNGIVVTGPNKLITVGGSGLSRINGYVDGHLRREILPMAGNYLFPVGRNGYAPVTAQFTSVNGPSSLTITSINSTLPGLLPATSLSRYWKMEETGDLVAILFFTYPSADVRGNPATYKLWFSNGGPPSMVAGATVLDPNNMRSQVGVTDFTGDWGIGNDLDPGPVSISGRVLTSNGAGIRNAIVTISGGNLPQPVNFQTGQFGIYQFSGLQAGETYTVHVAAKRYRFTATSQQATPMGNLADVDFVANPQDDF